MSADTTQITWDEIDEFEQAQPQPVESEQSLFERVTGTDRIVETQQPDGDRVSDEEPPEMSDGLDDALDDDIEVSYR